jgi:hypothetical protein
MYVCRTATALLLLTVVQIAQAQVVVLGSTLRQNGVTGSPNSPMVFTPRAFNYLGTPFADLREIDTVRLTVSIWNGGTAAGESGYNQLGLYIAGFDTGIRLNGFASGMLVQQTVVGRPLHAGEILSRLSSAGELWSSVQSITPFPQSISFSSGQITRLELIGRRGAVPEPGAAVLLAGLLGGAVLFVRTKRHRV